MSSAEVMGLILFKTSLLSPSSANLQVILLKLAPIFEAVSIRSILQDDSPSIDAAILVTYILAFNPTASILQQS